MKRGHLPAHGQAIGRADLAEEASLLLPEGTYGPGFLTLKNYYVLKDYNFSDLYVLFVGHLSDRMTDARPFETPWSRTAQPRGAQVEKMQRNFTRLGLYTDKIDGRAGVVTRAALGQRSCASARWQKKTRRRFTRSPGFNV
jgi:transglycosylase-like protein with SLT domain